MRRLRREMRRASISAAARRAAGLASHRSIENSADAERAPRHGARADPAAQQAVAQQRAERDPDRKDRQEQRDDRLLAAEHKPDIARKLRQVSRAGEPEP